MSLNQQNSSSSAVDFHLQKQTSSAQKSAKSLFKSYKKFSDLFFPQSFYFQNKKSLLAEAPNFRIVEIFIRKVLSLQRSKGFFYCLNNIRKRNLFVQTLVTAAEKRAVLTSILILIYEEKVVDLAYKITVALFVKDVIGVESLMEILLLILNKNLRRTEQGYKTFSRCENGAVCGGRGGEVNMLYNAEQVGSLLKDLLYLIKIIKKAKLVGLFYY